MIVDCNVCDPVDMITVDINGDELKDIVYYSQINDNIYWLEKNQSIPMNIRSRNY